MATKRAASTSVSVEEIANSKEYAKFADNRLGVLLLTMLTGNEDPDNVASESLVGGGNDKKIDCFLINLETKSAYIGQLYIARDWGKSEALANKASGLNTAAAWIFSKSGEKKLPKSVADRSVELRRLIGSGEITTLNMFYCHNCVESENVQNELDIVRESVQERFRSQQLNGVQVTAVEYGLRGLKNLIEVDPNQQFVDETKVIDSRTAIYQQTDEWDAVTATVDGDWLKKLHGQHRSKLFAPNFRDFLGTSERRRDINGGIKRTIEEEPQNFWVYNNGITILCKTLVARNKTFVVTGLAIVNGAQTTGSFSEASQVNGAQVLARFIRCKRKALIQNIIRFNNTQNEIKPSDTRANDHVQVRLQKDFKDLGVVYVMRRAGGKAPDGCVRSSVVGVSLAAYHGDTQLAARNSADIFLNDDVYGKVFRNDLTARHVAVVLALSTAIDRLKGYLKSRVDAEPSPATPSEKSTYEALRYSMSKHFVMSTIGALSAELVGTSVASLYKLQLKRIEGNTIQSLENTWHDVIRDLLPYIGQLIKELGDPYDITRDVSKVGIVAERCSAIIGILRSANPKHLQRLKAKIL